MAVLETLGPKSGQEDRDKKILPGARVAEFLKGKAASRADNYPAENKRKTRSDKGESRLIKRRYNFPLRSGKLGEDEEVNKLVLNGAMRGYGKMEGVPQDEQKIREEIKRLESEWKNSSNQRKIEKRISALEDELRELEKIRARADKTSDSLSEKAVDEVEPEAGVEDRRQELEKQIAHLEKEIYALDQINYDPEEMEELKDQLAILQKERDSLMAGVKVDELKEIEDGGVVNNSVEGGQKEDSDDQINHMTARRIVELRKLIDQEKGETVRDNYRATLRRLENSIAGRTSTVQKEFGGEDIGANLPKGVDKTTQENEQAEKINFSGPVAANLERGEDVGKKVKDFQSTESAQRKNEGDIKESDFGLTIKQEDGLIPYLISKSEELEIYLNKLLKDKYPKLPVYKFEKKFSVLREALAKANVFKGNDEEYIKFIKKQAEIAEKANVKKERYVFGEPGPVKKIKAAVRKVWNRLFRRE